MSRVRLGLGSEGPSDPATNIRAMTEDARTERTANLLIARLEALAHAAARLPYGETERLVELAAVATMRAIALDLICAERADAIWRDAHSRHPAIRRVAVPGDLPARLAA